MIRVLTPARLLVVLALATLVIGVRFSSLDAGGSDSYAYISQAELWLHGPLVTPMREATLVPWPDAVRTFTPLGYVPSVDGDAMVSQVPIGLPLLMAGAKLVGGQRAIFWVVPICGSLLVLATFAIARRIGSPWMAFTAACLVATSPTVLYQLLQPMTDVPAAAAWAVVTWCALIETTPAAWAGGLAASAAILIRPNLVPLGGIFALWIWSAGWRRAAAFIAGVIPGCLAIAYINNWWYGSPVLSGYGSNATLFSTSHVARNIAQYGRWVIETQTPLALAGIAALFTPAVWFWRTRQAARAAALLALVALTVFAIYCFYTPFDAWWYLRFLLPAFPAMLIGIAAVLARLFDRPSARWRAAAAVFVMGLCAWGVWLAVDRFAFEARANEAKYSAVAGLVRGATDQSSVILAVQHSGSLRYYAGRTTLRYDFLDPAWLDRAVDWLRAHNAHPYLLIEESERTDFERRFSGHSRFSPLHVAPVFSTSPSRVYLYDLEVEGDFAEPTPLPDLPATNRCATPQPPPALMFRGGQP